MDLWSQADLFKSWLYHVLTGGAALEPLLKPQLPYVLLHTALRTK